ncbi:MAG: hypothetical protein JXR75_07475 [Rhodobacteraceae bacterium]|nr:hypothetical protein [Paracoccaceae bacterium]
MAEPINNTEIEDVLSSIRRLVSQDLRPAPRPTPTAQSADVAEAGHLLLTPALRIVPTDPVAAAQPALDALVLAPEMVANAAPAAVAKDDVITRLGAAVVEDDWEAPEGDAEVWTPGGGLDAATFAHAPRAPLSDPTEGFDFKTPPYAEFDGFGSDAPTADVPDTDLSDIPEDAEDLHDIPVPPRRVSPPVDAGSWADDAEAAVMADLATPPVEDDMLDAPGPGMMAFDEEVLRDLVRDLIREELAGTLGERITRNVRKLVRAEIARALALREFE